MFKHHIDAAPPGDLAYSTFEPILVVINDVIGTKRRSLGRLRIATHGRNYDSARRLCQLDRCTSNPAPTRVYENRFSASELRIVEQHVLNSTERDWCHGRSDGFEAVRRFNGKARWNVGILAQEAIDMKSVHPAKYVAKIVSSFEAGLAGTASLRSVDRNNVAFTKFGNGATRPNDDPRRFSTGNYREFPVSERHAPPAPNINMVQRYAANSDLNLIGLRFWRTINLAQHESSLTCDDNSAH
jgi:hypothetical protein